MDHSFQVSLAAPDRSLYKGEVTQVNLPSIGGEMGVLAGHMPTIVGLKPGVVEIIDEKGKTPHHFAITGGFAEVRADELAVLVTSGEEADNLDEELIIEAKKRAEALKKEASTEQEFVEASDLLEKSLAELKTIERRRKWRL